MKSFVSEMKVARENALFFVKRLTADLARAKSLEDKEGTLVHLSAQHRVAGVTALLATGDLDELAAQLRQSAGCRVELLRLRSNAGAPFDRYSCASQTAPLFDGVVAGADDPVREIVRLSSTTWLEGEEFEDDFWYAHTVHGLVEGAPDVAQRLTSFAASFGDEESPRHALCTAMVARDQDAFDSAFAALLEERRAWGKDKKARVFDSPISVDIEAGLFVEGLALLALADRAGLATEDDYDMIPGLVRRYRAAGGASKRTPPRRPS